MESPHPQEGVYYLNFISSFVSNIFYNEKNPTLFKQ